MAALLENPELTRAPEPVAFPIAYRARVTLLAAPEKEGKTTLAAAIAAAVSGGGRFLGETLTLGDVLFFGLEEHLGDTLARLQDFGADPSHVFLAHNVLVRPLEELELAADARLYRCVIVDSLSAVAEGLVEDAGSSAAWTPVMARLTRLARKTEAGLVVLHHSRRSDGRYRDSSAIGAGVDAILEMATGADASVRTFQVRARWSSAPFAVRLLGIPGDSANPLRYDLESGELSIDARVLLFVERHPGCSTRALREGVSGRSRAIQDATQRLLDRGALENRGKEESHKLYAAPAVPEPEPRPPDAGSVLSASGTTPEPLGNRGQGTPGAGNKILAPRNRDT
jgi:hypothetical protein